MKTESALASVDIYSTDFDVFTDPLSVARFKDEPVIGSRRNAAMRRHEISDERWNKIKDLLPGKRSDPGRTAVDNRGFLNAVLWIAKTGAPWRDHLMVNTT